MNSSDIFRKVIDYNQVNEKMCLAGDYVHLPLEYLGDLDQFEIPILEPRYLREPKVQS